jgi:hypothetical protein
MLREKTESMGDCYEDRKVSFGPYIMWARTRCQWRRAAKTGNLSREQKISAESRKSQQRVLAD